MSVSISTRSFAFSIHSFDCMYSIHVVGACEYTYNCVPDLLIHICFVPVHCTNKSYLFYIFRTAKIVLATFTMCKYWPQSRPCTEFSFFWKLMFLLYQTFAICIILFLQVLYVPRLGMLVPISCSWMNTPCCSSRLRIRCALGSSPPVTIFVYLKEPLYFVTLFNLCFTNLVATGETLSKVVYFQLFHQVLLYKILQVYNEITCIYVESQSTLYVGERGWTQ